MNGSAPWSLDLPLVRFSRLEADYWTLADACQGLLILGENGSGKTSASGRLFARKYLEAGFGGLVLSFKTDEARLWGKKNGLIVEGIVFQSGRLWLRDQRWTVGRFKQ